MRFDFRFAMLLQSAALLCAAPAPSKAQTTLSFDVYRERVEPIFLKKRTGHGPGLSPCAACHAHSGTPLRLEDLEEGEKGRVFWSEDASRRNFELVSRLVVPGSSEHSRLLRKPLAVSAGGVALHVGGKFWQSQSDPEWQIIADWIRAASVRGTSTEAAARGLDFEFFRSSV